MQKLEQEAKKWIEKSRENNNSKLEEVLENIKLIRNVSEATLKKMKDINAKNNTDTWPVLVS